MHTTAPAARRGLHLPARATRPPRAVSTAAVPPPTGRRAMLLSLLGGAVTLADAPASNAAADATTTARRGTPTSSGEPFLSRSGARGVLAEEEKRLFQLRLQKEGEVIQEFDRARAELLEEEMEPGRVGQLCATPFGIDVVGIITFVALTGAFVGGFSARARKAEVERLNDQLRKINLSLRQQARAGTVYAPGLNYAPQPIGGGGVAAAAAAPSRAASPAPPAAAAVADAPTTADAPSVTALTSASSIISLDDDEVSPELRACIASLRDGKRLLKDKDGRGAMARFEKALMLAESLADPVHEKRAVRGLAAASRLNGDRRAAIAHLERVLQLSRAHGDTIGDSDALGTIADMYTELGAFEKAAEYYDRYIATMAKDGPV